MRERCRLPHPEGTARQPQAPRRLREGTIFVHIGGCVASPGVYELPSGSRISDAVGAAGGFAEDAAPDALNLARALADGERVIVPSAEDYARAGATASAELGAEADGGAIADGALRGGAIPGSGAQIGKVNDKRRLRRRTSGSSGHRTRHRPEDCGEPAVGGSVRNLRGPYAGVGNRAEEVRWTGGQYLRRLIGCVAGGGARQREAIPCARPSVPPVLVAGLAFWAATAACVAAGRDLGRAGCEAAAIAALSLPACRGRHPLACASAVEGSAVRGPVGRTAQRRRRLPAALWSVGDAARGRKGPSRTGFGGRCRQRFRHAIPGPG